MVLHYSYPQETLQEVPGEISLALSISGCQLRCKGCHSTETYSKDFGTELTELELLRLLNKHKYVTNVLLYGGEWNITELIKIINIIKSHSLKVALYTGYEISFFSKEFINSLDFIKTGSYNEKLGALNSPTTNQRFYKKIGKELVDQTSQFIK